MTTRVITSLNGRIPTSLLAPIGGGFVLRKDAAASYLRARAAGCPAGVNSAYRTYFEQAKLRAKYEAGGTLAERPGWSWHGEGMALDIPSASGAQGWLLAHPSYGWHRTIMPAEPWHFEYFPNLDTGDDMPSFDDALGINPATGKASTWGEQERISTNYSYYTWDIARAIDAKITGLVGAINALAAGEDFDEAKLLAGIETAAATGAQAGTTAALADIEGIVRDVAGVNADAILDALRARL